MADEALLERLQRAGLPRNEAKVYLELLRSEGLSGGDVARKAMIDRSLAYTVLNNLRHKGLVTITARHAKRYFFATDPSNLLTPVHDQEAYLASLLPHLHGIRKTSSQKQSVQMYEGVEGMKAYARLLLTQRRVLSFGGTGRFYDLMLQHAPHFMRKALHQFTDGRVIGSTELLAHPVNRQIGIRVRYIPVTSPTTTVVCDEFVAIHLIADKPFAIIISNPEIVNGYVAYFEFLWSQAATVPHKRRLGRATVRRGRTSAKL